MNIELQQLSAAELRSYRGGTRPARFTTPGSFVPPHAHLTRPPHTVPTLVRVRELAMATPL